jgi:large conductance mechanosensitive channel
MLKPNLPLEKTRVKIVKEFISFIKTYGVVGLAIGVVIGQSVNKLVNSIVDNLINPILGKILGEMQLTDIAPYGIKIGQFATDFINFLAIMFVVYISVRLFIVYLLTDEEKQKFVFLNKKLEQEKPMSTSETKPGKDKPTKTGDTDK